MQAAGASGLFGASTLPIEATLACSGADALALCLGAVLAYPAAWRARVLGAAGGAAAILALNTLRIGTLGRVVGSPMWFSALHVYVWPALLTVAIAIYVFAWMHLADNAHLKPVVSWRAYPSRRFVLLTLAFVVVFSVASPLYLESSTVLALASLVARAAATILGVFGVSSHATDNVLWTARGGFLVTQECVSTPLIPVYLAAVCAYAGTWRRWTFGTLAVLPVFTGLGVLRLLVVALPEAMISSPLFVVHAFYQLLLGAVVVCVASLWQHDRRAAAGYAAMGLLVGLLFVQLLGPRYGQLITHAVGAPLNDSQGAIAALPAFQIGLYLAVWVAAYMTTGWRRLLAGMIALVLMQTVGGFVLHAVSNHTGLVARVSDVRGWAIAGPLLIVAAVVNLAPARR